MRPDRRALRQPGGRAGCGRRSTTPPAASLCQGSDRLIAAIARGFARRAPAVDRRAPGWPRGATLGLFLSSALRVCRTALCGRAAKDRSCRWPISTLLEIYLDRRVADRSAVRVTVRCDPRRGIGARRRLEQAVCDDTG